MTNNPYRHLLTAEQLFIAEKLIRGFGFEHLGAASEFVWTGEGPDLEVEEWQIFQDMDNLAFVIKGEYFCLSTENIDYHVCEHIFNGVENCILANKAKWLICNPLQFTQLMMA